MLGEEGVGLLRGSPLSCLKEKGLTRPGTSRSKRSFSSALETSRRSWMMRRSTSSGRSWTCPLPSFLTLGRRLPPPGGKVDNERFLPTRLTSLMSTSFVVLGGIGTGREETSSISTSSSAFFFPCSSSRRCFISFFINCFSSPSLPFISFKIAVRRRSSASERLLLLAGDKGSPISSLRTFLPGRSLPCVARFAEGETRGT